MKTTQYWSWPLRQGADVNEELRNACASYQRKFARRPWLVVVPPDATPHPIAGLSIQVNAFLPNTSFYFAKPNTE